MSIRDIQRATLHTWLTQGGLGPTAHELAVLDVREPAAFGNGAPLYATNLPLARLDVEVANHVPRRSVRVVLVDDGDGDAARAAAVLDRLGYTDLYVLAGGVPAWKAADALGQPTFDIPGNIFAGSIRDLQATPSIDAVRLQALRDEGRDVVVLDTRTPAEFADAHVPGALNAPGEEILQRFLDVVPDPNTFVVVSCAGLPRAIIGAQTLIDARVPNRVVLLEDGTVGWTRASFELERGADATRQRASDAAVTYAVSRAAELAARVPVPVVDRATLAAWRADGERRTTYVLDVRSRDEYDAGHLDGAISSPGGQLLGVTYRTLATRGARVVLVDDDGTRATTTAYWLRQRGWEVAVLAADSESSSLKYAAAN
ncbi:Rhodanese-related sulfurtransferase [Paraburkholderia unamae]|nr:Rhodanese-related sulfurtransferase [Paraburkholderia unamae]